MRQEQRDKLADHPDSLQAGMLAAVLAEVGAAAVLPPLHEMRLFNATRNPDMEIQAVSSARIHDASPGIPKEQ